MIEHGRRGPTRRGPQRMSTGAPDARRADPFSRAPATRRRPLLLVPMLFGAALALVVVGALIGAFAPRLWEPTPILPVGVGDRLSGTPQVVDRVVVPGHPAGRLRWAPGGRAIGFPVYDAEHEMRRFVTVDLTRTGDPSLADVPPPWASLPEVKTGTDPLITNGVVALGVADGGTVWVDVEREYGVFDASVTTLYATGGRSLLAVTGREQPGSEDVVLLVLDVSKALAPW